MDGGQGETDVYSRSFESEEFTPVRTRLNLSEAPAFEVFMLTVTVSGSFHRHMGAITAAVHDLAALSVRVLSPADPRIVAEQGQGEFLFVASDPVRSVRLVQDRHLDCIRAASFVWLVCPDGYVGVSAAMEIGAAREAGVPIFGTRAPNDITMREYVTVVPSLSEAVRRAEANDRPRRPHGILINPRASIEEAHDLLERIGSNLFRQTGSGDPAPHVHRAMKRLSMLVAAPEYMN
jgi:hypothetical protein